MSVNYIDEIKQKIATTDRVEMAKRLIVLWQVAMYGLAYEQVELPSLLYVLPSYLSAVVFYYLCCLRPVPFLQYQLIPLTFFLVRFIWAIIHGEEIKPELLTVLTISNLMFLSRESKIWVYMAFRKFMVFMCGAGVICYISYSLGLGLPHITQPYYFGNSIYANFHVAYITSYANGGMPRLCGLFNEPGYLGTIAAFTLIVDRMNWRRVGNIIIFVAGVFAFSFAFWILVLLYYLLRHATKPARIVLVVLAVFGGLAYIQTVKFENESVQFLVNRFAAENGKVKGDNRCTHLFDMMYDDLFRSDQYMWGRGDNSLNVSHLMTLSYATYIYKYGVVGFALLWLIPMLMACKYSRKNVLCYVFVAIFFASTYQRPHFYTPLYFGLLFGGIDYIYSTQKIIEGKKDDEEEDDETDLDAIKMGL